MAEEKKDSIAICLNCYTVRFNKKYTDVSRTFDEVFQTTDLGVIMRRFISAIDKSNYYRNKSANRILYLNKTLKLSSEENIYVGIIMKGHNGPQTQIDELAGSKVKQVGTVSKDQYHCLPYLALIYLNPNNPDKLLFIAQSYKQYGFKEIFEECFRDFVQQISIDTYVKFNPLSAASHFKRQLENGKLKGLRFIKHGLNKNVEALVKGDNVDPKEYTMELSVKANKGGGFLGLKNRLDYDDTSFVEQIQIEGFDHNEIYADLVVAGRKRVMNISKPKEFSAAYDITDKILVDQNTKLPNFEQIMNEALDILKNDLIPHV